MTVARRAKRPGEWQRYAAPAAFLLAVTIAVLLVRGSLDRGSETTPTTAVTTTKPRTTSTAAKTTTRTRTRTAVAGEFYEVQAGDTFGSIAARYGKTVEEIEALNPGVSSTSLHVGQKIRVG